MPQLTQFQRYHLHRILDREKSRFMEDEARPQDVYKQIGAEMGINITPAQIRAAFKVVGIPIKKSTNNPLVAMGHTLQNTSRLLLGIVRTLKRICAELQIDPDPDIDATIAEVVAFRKFWENRETPPTDSNSDK